MATPIPHDFCPSCGREEDERAPTSRANAWKLAVYHEALNEVRWGKERAGHVVRWAVALQAAIVVVAPEVGWGWSIALIVGLALFGLLWIMDLHHETARNRDVFIRIKEDTPEAHDYGFVPDFDPNNVRYLFGFISILLFSAFTTGFLSWARTEGARLPFSEPAAWLPYSIGLGLGFLGVLALALSVPGKRMVLPDDAGQLHPQLISVVDSWVMRSKKGGDPSAQPQRGYRIAALISYIGWAALGLGFALQFLAVHLPG